MGFLTCRIDLRKARRVYEVEPNLTLKTLRARMTYMHESVWDTFSKGLRLARMPERILHVRSSLTAWCDIAICRPSSHPERGPTRSCID
jgi:hypothetical protein